MGKTRVYDIKKCGQSIWYDNIQRTLITSGKLACMVQDDGVCGVTSNPAIFEKAIAGSSDYDAEIKTLAAAGKSAEDIYDALTIKDVSLVADVLADIYKGTDGRDGYVSLEVSPRYAYDAKKTVEEALRLVKAVNKPNLMIKVPATKDGITAIKELVGRGICINATLIFSLDHYRAVAMAYIEGLNELAKKEKDLSKENSVASFFVSRLDTAVDKQLDTLLSTEKDASRRKSIEGLRGQTAIAYTKKAYQLFKELFSRAEFTSLIPAGARTQRPLWASTGTKNPAFSDVMYIEELIAPDTVNTVPHATLDAFRDHGKAADVIEQNIEKEFKVLSAVENLGINVNDICQGLQKEGVAAFEKSFDTLLGAIQQKMAK